MIRHCSVSFREKKAYRQDSILFISNHRQKTLKMNCDTTALLSIQYNTIQYNKNLFKHGKIVQYKKTTKTDLQDCRVGVTIDIDKDNNHL